MTRTPNEYMSFNELTPAQQRLLMTLLLGEGFIVGHSVHAGGKFRYAAHWLTIKSLYEHDWLEWDPGRMSYRLYEEPAE